MNANYKNNNKNAIVKKIESNFQQQYKGNMNNKKLQATTTNNNNNNKNAIVKKIAFKKPQPTTNNMANNNQEFVLNLFVEIMAYKYRLITAEEAGAAGAANAAAKEITWRLRTLQYSRSVKVANETLVKAGLEKHGWKKVQEEQRQTPTPTKPKKIKLTLKKKTKA